MTPNVDAGSAPTGLLRTDVGLIREVGHDAFQRIRDSLEQLSAALEVLDGVPPVTDE